MWSFLVLFLFGVVFAECLVYACGLGVHVIVRVCRGAGRAVGRPGQRPCRGRVELCRVGVSWSMPVGLLCCWRLWAERDLVVVWWLVDVHRADS
jgi:hypothetical protein